jgi:hypothetical protein
VSRSLQPVLQRDLEEGTKEPRAGHGGWSRGFWSGAPEGIRTPNLLIRSVPQLGWPRTSSSSKPTLTCEYVEPPNGFARAHTARYAAVP